jgi:hypothetical protein
MKFLFTILIGLSTLSTFAQNNQTIVLKWKVGKDEKLSYNTIMRDVDSSSFEMNFGNVFGDSSKERVDKGAALLKKMQQDIQNQNYVTTLSNKGHGIIDVVMSTKPQDTQNDSSGNKGLALNKLLPSMNQGVVLRGAVYETGGVESFWVKSSQKNLIALLFELPTSPVKVGDKWPLYVNLIENDQNFDCDSSYKINEVTLTDIKRVNGETIAVLRYNIAEYVKGIFNVPSMFGNQGGPKDTKMKLTHQGTAEFSVDKGRWVMYDAIMTFEATGVMTANKKTRFALLNTAGK